MILIIEGVVMCFVLLLVCVFCIANGPVGLSLVATPIRKMPSLSFAGKNK